MRYALFDIEVTRPLADLGLSEGTRGYAILARRNDVPIGFWMQPVPTSVQRIPASGLAEQLAAKLGVTLVAAAIRDELMPRQEEIRLPRLTIAICTKDRVEYVQRLLESLSGMVSALPTGCLQPEILVVDNAPADESTRRLSRNFDVRYVCEPRAGLNFARNRALQEAGGEYLAFLDDDVVPDRRWLHGLSAAWSANPDAAAFTGQVLPFELETEAQIIFELRGGFRRGFERMRYGPVSPTGDRLYPAGAGNFGTGANMMFRVDVLRRLGGFDEALDTGAHVPGGGDLDMFYRIIRAGRTLVYEPAFLVFHQHRRDMKGLARQYRRSWGFGFSCYLIKCFRSDPERRKETVRLLIWWFVNSTVNLLVQLKKKIRGVPHVPPVLLLGELWGGVVGLTGGYGRSRRRIEGIRRKFPARGK